MIAKEMFFRSIVAKKLVLILTALSVFLAAEVAFGEIAIGVKEGDWIEYKVYTTGVPVEGHNVVWARMEILKVQGNEITVNTTTQETNGTLSSVVMILNPEKGEVDIWAIIPANLSKGNVFFDKNLGNILVEGEEQRTYAGVVRDTTVYNSSTRFKRWDKQTGVFLEGTDELPDYTLTAVFDKTNLWSNQIFGLDPAVFYALILGLIVVTSTALVITKSKSSKGASE